MTFFLLAVAALSLGTLLAFLRWPFWARCWCLNRQMLQLCEASNLALLPGASRLFA